jgi:hypothetical protein
MPEVTLLSPELSRSVPALARLAASRRWSLYPPGHPTVRTSVEPCAPRLPPQRRRVLTFM